MSEAEGQARLRSVNVASPQAEAARVGAKGPEHRGVLSFLLALDLQKCKDFMVSQFLSA